LANNLLSIIDGKIQIKNDAYGKVDTFTPFICRADKKIICSLTGVTKFDVALKLTDISEIDFTVSKYITNSSTFEQELNPAYKYLNSFYGILIPELGQYGYFRINEEPTIKAENTRYEMKSFTAYSGESVMQYEHITGFFVNQGTTQSLEMFTENLTPTGLPEKKIQLYNPDDSKLSLLDLVLSDDYYGWTIGHVDRSIQTLMRAFSISNSQNVYSFLTKDVAQAFRCIFDFDTIHNIINVYSIEDYGKNTNIYLSFERFIQELKVKQSNDEIYTVFNVRGDNDLDISYVNFGSNKIVNVNYPLYMMDKEIYETYKLYESYRDSLRQSYKDLMIDYSHQQQLLSALMDRQPQDSINNNWSSTVYYSLDDLQTDLAMFKSAVELIEQIYTDESGAIDYEELNKSADAALYYSYKSVNIPDIENEIKFRNGTIGKREEKVNSDIIWEMYGLNDLILKRDTYLELIDTLAESGYTEPWDNTKTISRETWNAHYQEWQDYQVYVEELNELIDKKTEQVNDIKEEIDYDLAQLKDIAEKSSLEYYYDTFGENFSDDAVNYPQIIKSLYKESDYVDSNYLITSTDDTLAIIAESEELYQAAKKRLDIESRPQLVWSVDTDNLYATKDFESLRNHLQLGDFINLVYNTEHIMNGYGESAVDTESEGSLEAEMIIEGRNLLSFTNEPHSVEAKNGSVEVTEPWELTYTGSIVCNSNDATEMLYTLTANYTVDGNLNNNAQIYPLCGGTIISSAYDDDSIVLFDGDVDDGVYKVVFKFTIEQFLSDETIRFAIGNATEGSVLTVTNVKLEIGDKATKYSPAPEDTPDYDAENDTSGTDSIDLENNTFIGKNCRFRVSEINFNALDYSDFSITFADIIKSRAGSSDIESILDSYISSRSNQIRIDASNNASAVASEVAASLIKPYLQVTNTAIENAQITNAQIEDLEAVNATIRTLMTNYLEADSATIFDLVTENITVNKYLEIVSDINGSVAFDNSRMKFFDADNNLRMLIGADTNNVYDVKIYSAADGNGNQKLLWNTQSGIQSDAIADSLISTNMLGNNSVTKNKINWTGISDSVDASGTPIFNSNQITLNGSSLTTQWGAMQTTTNGIISDVADVSMSADKLLMVVSQSVNDTQTYGADGVYDNTKSYSAGDIVVYNGKFYKALVSTTGNLPTDANYWDDVSSDYSDSIVKTAFSEIAALRDSITLAVSGTNGSSTLNLKDGTLSLTVTDVANILANKQLNLTSQNGVINIYGGGGVNIGTDTLGSLTVHSPNFKLTNSGYMVASRGTIGNWEIKENELSSFKIFDTNNDEYTFNNPWISGYYYRVGDQVNLYELSNNYSSYTRTHMTCVQDHISSSNKLGRDYWSSGTIDEVTIEGVLYNTIIDSYNSKIDLIRRNVTGDIDGQSYDETILNANGLEVDSLTGKSIFHSNGINHTKLDNDDFSISSTGDIVLNNISLGNTSISSIGDGSITGAISNLNSSKSNLLSKTTYTTSDESIAASAINEISINVATNDKTPIGIIECAAFGSASACLTAFWFDNSTTVKVRIKNLSTGSIQCHARVTILYVNN